MTTTTASTTTTTAAARADRPAAGRARRALALGAALATGLTGAVVLGAGGSATAGTSTSQWGTLSSPDIVMPAANKCASYTYSYDLRPPAGKNWSAEFFIHDAQGRTIGSQGVLSNYSPHVPSGSTTFELCSNNADPGTYRLSGIFSVGEVDGTTTTYAMPAATFAVTAPPTAPAAAAADKKVGKGKKAKKKAALRAAKKAAAQRAAARRAR